MLPIVNPEQYKRYKEVSKSFKNYYNSEKDSDKRQNMREKLKSKGMQVPEKFKENNAKYPHFNESYKIRKSIEHAEELMNKLTTFSGNSIGNAAVSAASKKQEVLFKKGGGIHIKPENKGKFTATMKRTGKTAEQLAHSKNPLTRKRAIFAINSRKWKHLFGGTFKGIATDNSLMVSKDKNANKSKPKLIKKYRNEQQNNKINTLFERKISLDENY